MIEIYTDRWIAKNGATPSTAWSAAIGHLTENQLATVVNGCLERCAAGNTWPPDLAEFMSLVTECGANPFGLNVDDVMAEYKRWRNESYRYSGSEKFPWRHPVLYHICIEMRRAGVERRMTAGELERLAERQLTKWVKNVSNGMSIPPIRRQLAAPKHPAGPTPAELAYAEYKRRKAAGLI
ncbi:MULTISPECIES: replication protein P [Brenneria]|uniref:Replication protein n=1 Tax=Brenneria nigrifluens DSM 30175 = ATCC 13028 TaxID=1121120 RepID=A0A2U1UU70_9GAMM|nr:MULTISPECIES: replication protein P [Brenneria]PWC25162.1 replication protein [Brenneria nigrifluens] [Brenneria nigrifluens DSM 30175 = ATCC 13028]QCR06926.1 replication protein [Brenneria nigrifluens] [Brenneria nigrifluens DSM 30175 = ATCC 13028]